ncbi:MAG: flagellar biosynthesis protein FlgA [Nitrospinae bacterium CG11_big_fil_rev_8_21_14_0_20_45_15]|nr:MAG: flagellar biosynthesis protein FlgA [Nitrospinae bacterium CG11_big_fil_rev_8_21_14_0_20_45_15]
MRCKHIGSKAIFWLILFMMFASQAESARIKDLTNIRGVRSNQLIGFGLVIGLTGTGDSATNVFFSIQTMVSMLKKMGVTVPTDKVNQLKFKNVATVMVTADLPAFARQGDKIDVTISSVGDSKSLQGGTLLMTPLKGPDSTTYAIAQGPISIGGFAVSGQARGIQKNHLTVGRISNGALVEKEISIDFNNKEEILFSMKKTDFTTASRISQKINDKLKNVYASVIDARSIKVIVPPEYIGTASMFVNELESLDVDPDISAKVIVDERTGTVVMGENVRLSTVAVAHGSLFIEIKEEPLAVQPPPIAPESAQTAILPRTRIAVQEGRDQLLVVPKGISLGDVVSALNSIGVTPRDLISILQAIKASGSLHAELDII